MNERPRQFNPLQAEEIARAFAESNVEYLFIGKSGAILLGYPATTQDVDVVPDRSEYEQRHPSRQPLKSAADVARHSCAE